MSEFSESVKRRALLAGLSLRALAAAVPVDDGHLSRMLASKRPLSLDVAARLDRLLGDDGQLLRLAREEAAVAQAATVGVPEAGNGERPWDDADVQSIRDRIAHLVALDTAHGGGDLHKVALRAFTGAARRLADGTYRPGVEKDLQAAVAELGQVAAWLAYDAEDQEASRRVATDAAMIARLAGDTAMERFILSHLSMQSAYCGRGREAINVADRVLAEEPVSRRLTGMFHLRRARGLAALGAGTEALKELDIARGLLADGTSPRDPAWTGWLHTAEMSVHEGRIRAAAGDLRGAVDLSRYAVESLPARQGRDQVLYRAWLLQDLVSARSWADAEKLAGELEDLIGEVGSARVPRILRGVLDTPKASGLKVPRKVLDAVRAALEAAS